MTKYFEVTRRDAAARLGKLLLDDHYPTPLILHPEKDSPIIFAGSLWARNILSPDKVDTEKLVILPGKPMPLHARPEMVKEINDSAKQKRQQWEKRDGATGQLVHPSCPDITHADMYVIGAAKQMENNPRMLLDTVIHIKNNTPPDTALYAPALATPENLCLLIYLGIDIVDDILPTIKAYDGIYMMPDREYKLSDLPVLPCSCSVCSNTSVEDLQEMSVLKRGKLLARHNVNRLAEEKQIAIQRIKNGNLREYVEGKCRSSPWLTALLKLMDQEHVYLEQHTPTYRSGTMYANTSESLNRIEVRRFAERVRSQYQAPLANILLLLPCSARKPYSISNSHQMFNRATGRNRRALNEVIITSPMGIVPRELELVYPAAHYDIPVTGHWDLEERFWVTGCLVDYLETNKYSHIIAHVDGAYKDICQSAAETLDLDIIFTAQGSVTSARSLGTLRSTVSGIVQDEGYVLRKTTEMAKNILRGIADYQFGRGAGWLLVPDGASIRAPFPKYQVFYDKKQLASLNPRTGTLIPTLEGAMRLLELGTYQIHIDDFVPSGNLLAPGVVDADVNIRPSDQVTVVSERVLGVGRAMMGGFEMIRSTRGIAVDLRKVREI
jgi:archaeosine synthase